MNQYGLVELVVIKDQMPYRVLVPMGRPWSEAKEALLEIIADIDAHLKTLEDQKNEAVVEDSSAA
jgi:hypothetical protein